MPPAATPLPSLAAAPPRRRAVRRAATRPSPVAGWAGGRRGAALSAAGRAGGRRRAAFPAAGRAGGRRRAAFPAAGRAGGRRRVLPLPRPGGPADSAAFAPSRGARAARGRWTATRCPPAAARVGGWRRVCLSGGRVGLRAAPRLPLRRPGGPADSDACASPADGGPAGGDAFAPRRRRAGWWTATRCPFPSSGGLAGDAAFTSPADGRACGRRRVCLSCGRAATHPPIP
jgi:hypothetical protein